MRSSIWTAVFVLALAFEVRALDLDIDLGAGVGVGTGKEGSTDGWSVQVCRPLTDAKRVTIEVAEPGSKDRDKISWDRAATRDAGKIQELPLPSRFRDLGRIWIQASAEPKESDVHLAVLNAGKVKRVFSFHKRMKSEISVKDADVDFDCSSG